MFIKIQVFILSVTLFLIQGISSHAEPFLNVLEVGAVNDGNFKNTEVIKKAINMAAESGGGTVYFPAGNYLTGPIHMKSNITLYIDAGATIKFSEDFDDYLPMVPTRFQGINCNGFSPLIYGYEVENVSIIGQGTVDGQGDIWQKTIKELKRKNRAGIEVPLNKWQEIYLKENPGIKNPDQSGFQRPLFIQFFNSSNIKIRDINIKNSPFWTVHFVNCENVLADGLYIKNPEESSNTDGINPESSQNVTISNCVIDVGDDCITIKSGKGKEARDNYKPSKNIQILNCTMLHGAGGVAIGSEMSAGVENVVISNCLIQNTGKGIHIKTNRERGGYVKNVRVSNVIIKDILHCHDKVPAGIHLNAMYYLRDSIEYKPVSESTPVLKNLHFSNITLSDVEYPFYLYGLGEQSIEDVTFSDIDIRSNSGIHLKYVDGVMLNNISMESDQKQGLISEQVKRLRIKDFYSKESRGKNITLKENKDVDISISTGFPEDLVIKGKTTLNVNIRGKSTDAMNIKVEEGLSNEVSLPQ